jgi:Skp family chaperone for outer membrane proteins
MNKSIAGMNILDKLKSENKTNQNNFKKKEEAFKKEESDLIKQKNVLQQIDFEKKVLNLREKISNYNKDKSKIIAKFKKKQLNAQSELYKAINSILVKYADENSISIILKKESIIIGQSDLDISQEILDRLNTQVKNININ